MLNELLIIAQSARFLAQSASRASIPVTVLDAFADADTQNSARSCHRIDFEGLCRFGCLPDDVLLELNNNLPANVGIVYGSGMESAPSVITALAAGVNNTTLYGNSAEVVEQYNDPEQFFGLLDELKIAYPKTQFNRPEDPSGWLIKQAASAGGGHVFKLNTGSVSDHSPVAGRGYYQRYISGRVYSLVFLANGTEASIIGFNTLRKVVTPGVPEFTYGGAINRAHLTPACRSAVDDIAARLVRATGLVGLNGIDFVLDKDAPLLLELNPRPTATCELYDRDYDRGILSAHVAACNGELPVMNRISSVTVRAHGIIYAEHMTLIPEIIHWPNWVSDRPAAGVYLPAGAPLCSVHAEGANEDMVSEQITRRISIIRKLLTHHRNAA